MFKKIKELLEAGKIDTETAEALDSEVSAALKDLRDEAASYRVKYQELNQTFEEVKGSKEKLEEQLNGLDEQIRKAKEDGKAELVTELERQKSEKEELATKLRELEESNRAFRIESELNKALSKFDVVDSEVISEVLKNRIIVEDNGVRFADGDNKLTVEDGLKKFFDEKPHLLKPAGRPGSGTEGGGSGGSEKKWEEMSATERMQLFKEDPKKYEQLKTGAK